MSQLKPCPFCRSELRIVEIGTLKCEKGHEFHPTGECRTEEEMVELWNNQPLKCPEGKISMKDIRNDWDYWWMDYDHDTVTKLYDMIMCLQPKIRLFPVEGGLVEGITDKLFNELGESLHDDTYSVEYDGRNYLVMWYEGCLYDCKEIIIFPRAEKK